MQFIPTFQFGGMIFGTFHHQKVNDHLKHKQLFVQSTFGPHTRGDTQQSTTLRTLRRTLRKINTQLSESYLEYHVTIVIAHFFSFFPVSIKIDTESISYLIGVEMIMGFFEIHKQIEQDLAFLSDWAMFHLGTDH